jgi:hypothetical protein
MPYRKYWKSYHPSTLKIWFPVREMTYLCIRCRDLGVIVEADLAALYLCRGHLAEDRVNEILRASQVTGRYGL